MSPKKALYIVTAAVLLWYVITQPADAGQRVQDILGWLREGAEAIITFIRSIFS